jgi:hypothetical protein
LPFILYKIFTKPDTAEAFIIKERSFIEETQNP